MDRNDDASQAKLLVNAADDAGLPSKDEYASAEPLPRGYVPRRRVFVATAFLGTVCVYLLRSDLSAAVLPMAKQLGWSKATQGGLLSAYYYGYVVAQLPGASLSIVVGGRRAVAGCALAAAALSIATPAAAVAGPGYAVLVRALIGLAEGSIYPSIHGLIGAWAPPGERSASASIIYSGNYLGTALALGLTAAQVSVAGGPAFAWARVGGGDVAWAWVFYSHALVVALWAAAWLWLVRDSPGVHEGCAPGERAALDAARPPPQLPSLAALAATPWRAILRTRPFYAVVVNHFTTNFSTYVLSSWLPTFIADYLGEKPDTAGVDATTPYLLAWAVAVCGGLVADRAITRGTSVTLVRKVAQCASVFVTAGLLAAVTYVPTASGALAVLTLAVGVSGLTETGYHCNHVDLFPAHAATAFAVTNLVGNMGGIVGPQLIGAILNTSDGSNPSVGQWRESFFLAAGVNVFGGVVWALFASGERQL